jgi:hypothetical protein
MNRVGLDTIVAEHYNEPEVKPRYTATLTLALSRRERGHLA